MNSSQTEVPAGKVGTRQAYSAPELVLLEVSTTSKLNWMAELAAPTVLQAS